jgi:hypothetical protein
MSGGLESLLTLEEQSRAVLARIEELEIKAQSVVEATRMASEAAAVVAYADFFGDEVLRNQRKGSRWLLASIGLFLAMLLLAAYHLKAPVPVKAPELASSTQIAIQLTTPA